MYTTSKELFNKFAPTFNLALPNPDGGLLYKVNEEYGNE